MHTMTWKNHLPAAPLSDALTPYYMTILGTVLTMEVNCFGRVSEIYLYISQAGIVSHRLAHFSDALKQLPSPPHLRQIIYVRFRDSHPTIVFGCTAQQIRSPLYLCFVHLTGKFDMTARQYVTPLRTRIHLH